MFNVCSFNKKCTWNLHAQCWMFVCLHTSVLTPGDCHIWAVIFMGSAHIPHSCFSLHLATVLLSYIVSHDSSHHLYNFHVLYSKTQYCKKIAKYRLCVPHRDICGKIEHLISFNSMIHVFQKTKTTTRYWSRVISINCNTWVSWMQSCLWWYFKGGWISLLGTLCCVQQVP